MRFSAKHELVVAALLNVQREIQPVVKDAKNPMLNSTYATLAAITDYARPLLAKHELFLIQGGDDPHDAAGVTLLAMKTRLIHVSGQWVENIVYAPIAEQNSKDGKERKATAQTAGSVITYLRRYGLSALLALTTDEDDDGNRASQQQKRESRAASREINAQQVTEPSKIPFPPLKGLEQYKGQPLRGVPTEAITEAYTRASGQAGKSAAAYARAMEEELERRRDLNDFEKAHPALAEA
jgi:hypothetical protein